MIKISNECVSKYLLRFLEQTESKYGEALAHSDGLTKHSVLVMRKISEMKNIFFIFGDNDFWIAQYVSFQYLLVCKMNYSAFTDYLRWYIAA